MQHMQHYYLDSNYFSSLLWSNEVVFNRLGSSKAVKRRPRNSNPLDPKGTHRKRSTPGRVTTVENTVYVLRKAIKKT